jgi:hypothetical protein
MSVLSLRTNLQRITHSLGLAGLAIGLSTSKVVLSLSMMVLAISLLLEGAFLKHVQHVRRNKPLLLLLVFWLLHLIGIFWSKDLDYAWGDIRVKLSLIVIPILLVMLPPKSPISLKTVLSLFLAGLIVTSLINYIVFQQHLSNNSVEDIRQLSLFGSHIRYGILIAMGVAVSIWLITETKTIVLRIALAIIIMWLSYYTYFSQVISGFIAFVVVLFYFICWFGYQYHKLLGWTLGSLVTFILVLTAGYFLSPVPKEKLDVKSLPKLTKHNHPYTHNLEQKTFENGKAVLAFVCEEELRIAWNRRSKVPYDSSDNKGQPLRFTLMRYMTSKGLHKDLEGMKILNQQDIQLIENGQCNILESNQGILARVEGLKYQLHNSLDPNGHSLLQRLHYWDAAIRIIHDNWLMGVGTGDVDHAFQRTYQQIHSPLDEKNRLRAHNSYLTAAVTFGIPGLILFLMMNGFFLYQSIQAKQTLAVSFMLVALCTFFIEDTLETQTGASFYAFFFGLLAVEVCRGAIKDPSHSQ